jgi:hypothetical protein
MSIHHRTFDGEISPSITKLRIAIGDVRLGFMHLGKRPKVAIGSWSSRRIRLGIAHHGAPSAWTAPVKDTGAEQRKPNKKRR